MIAEGGKIGSYAAFRKIAADFAIEERGSPATTSWPTRRSGWRTSRSSSSRIPSATRPPTPSSTRPAATSSTARRTRPASITPARPGLAGTPAGQEGRRRTPPARPRRQADRPQRHRPEGRAGRRRAVPGQDAAGLLLGHLGRTGQGRPARAEQAREKYKTKGFEVIGVCLDNDRADVDKFLKANALPWPQIFEQGGMDGRLATEYGIISLPTMFLVDSRARSSTATSARPPNSTGSWRRSSVPPRRSPPAASPSISADRHRPSRGAALPGPPPRTWPPLAHFRSKLYSFCSSLTVAFRPEVSGLLYFVGTRSFGGVQPGLDPGILVGSAVLAMTKTR